MHVFPATFVDPVSVASTTHPPVATTPFRTSITEIMLSITQICHISGALLHTMYTHIVMMGTPPDRMDASET